MELEKISSAFEPFLEDTGASEKRDAIVVFKPKGPSLAQPIRGRKRKLKERLDYVKARAAAQVPMQKKVFAKYKAEGRKRLPKTRTPELGMKPIGGGSLPVMQVEVTRKTLPALMQEDVVAVFPNQNVSLIAPKKIDYAALGKTEQKNGITWGLQELGIPELWDTGARGTDIRVGVMDTGVHGDHPALGGRVKGFIVADDRGRPIQAEPSFDAGSHGTHVCGTIAGGKSAEGVAIGVAPEAELHVAGVIRCDLQLGGGAHQCAAGRYRLGDPARRRHHQHVAWLQLL